MSEFGPPQSELPAYYPTGSSPEQWAAPAPGQPAAPSVLSAPSAPPPAWPNGGYPSHDAYPPNGPYPPYYGALAPAPARPSRWPILVAVVVFVVAVGTGAVLVVRHLHSGSGGAPSQSALAAMNVQPADLPGWTSAPDTDDNSDDGDLVCPAIGADPVPVTEADSPKFSLDNTTVNSKTATFTSAAVVSGDMKRLSNPAVPGCLQQSIAAEFAKGAATSTVRASNPIVTVTPAPAGSPKGMVATIEFRATLTDNDGASASFVFDEIVIAHGAVEAEIEISQIGSEIPSELATSLTKDVSDRVTRSH